MKREQYALDFGDGAPPSVVFEGKTFDPARMGKPERRRFGGATYDEALDGERLNGQYERVWAAMLDAKWRTLAQIALITGDPPASISARLRDFRKASNGAHAVERKRVAGVPGLHVYRLTPKAAP
jgi:hypothetical protein